jgi:hypothetical protein
VKKSTVKFISVIITFALALVFVVRFGTPSLLQSYVRFGIGDCRSIPVFCMVPVSCASITEAGWGSSFDPMPYFSENLAASVPRGFTVVEEILSRPFYKKHKRMDKGNVVYLLRKDKGFFPGLFPQLKASGVSDDYEFIRRVMNAKIAGIRNLTDTFFVIMKGVFIPDLGNQANVKMCAVELEGMKGFINYNLGDKDNLFDCNFIGRDGSFYKVYIKDREKRLGLAEVEAVVASLRSKN